MAVKGNRLSKNARKAARKEAELCRFEMVDKELEICWASMRAVAKQVDVTHAAVAKFRKNPLYDKARGEAVAKKIDENMDARQGGVSKSVKSNRNEGSAADAWRHFGAHLVTSWDGPVKSPLDGKTYNTPEEYFEHIKNTPGTIPIPKTVNRKS